MNKYFFQRRLENDPEVITSHPGDKGITHYMPLKLKGEHYRVKPHHWHEIQYIAALEIGVDVWAPYRGEGVILTKKSTPIIK